MKSTMKKEMYEFIAEFKKIIKINRDKIPEYYLDREFFYDTVNKLDKNMYNIDELHLKYIDFLNKFGDFVNEYKIDIDQIKKSILDKINEYCRIRALIVADFSEEGDNTYEDELEEDNSKDRLKKDNSGNKLEEDDSKDRLKKDELLKLKSKTYEVLQKIQKYLRGIHNFLSQISFRFN